MRNSPGESNVRVVGIGECVIDEIHSKSAVTSVPGGCPMNGAIALARQGVKAAVLSPISTDDDGIEIIRHMQSSGVDTSLLKIIDKPTTRVIIPINDHGDGGYYLAEGDHTQMNWLPEHVFAGPKEGDILLVSGSFSLAFEPIANAFDPVFDVGSDYHVIYFDPNVRTGFIEDTPEALNEAYARFDRWVEKSTIVKLSIEDAKWRYPDLGPREIVENLIGESHKLVFLTDGPGSVYVGSKMMGVFDVAIEPIDDSEIVDTVGAGDTFNAGILKGLIESNRVTKDEITLMGRSSARELVQGASQLAAQVCRVAGANPPWASALQGHVGELAF